MVIVVVIHTLPPYSVGGSETCAEALAAELAKRHRVVVCAGRPAEARSRPRREDRRGFTIEWLDADPERAPTFDAAYQNVAIERQFEEVMARIEPDLVHLHGIWGLSNSLPIIAQRRGAAVVFTLHDFWLMCPRGQRLRPSDLTQCDDIDLDRCSRCLEPWIAPPRLPSWRQVSTLFTGAARPPVQLALAKARVRLFRPPEREDAAAHLERYHARTREVIDSVDLFVSPSRFLAREFRRRYGLADERLVHSDNGIDTADLAGCPCKEPASVVRFGFLGSWMPSKGVHVLVEAFRGLTENARLIVFGGPPSSDPGVYARDVFTAAAPDRRISFPGRVAPEQRVSAFRAIDVLVVPSLWYENAPLTIREAFASHTPVVASRSGGMAESVREQIDGLLFAPGSVTDLRAVLRRLIHEPELIPRLSRQTPPVKSVEAHAIELEAAYRRVLARTRPLAHAAGR